MNNCFFCDTTNNSHNKRWENEYFFIMFDSNPVSPGHILIIPKRHMVGIGDLNAQEWENLHHVITEGIALINNSNLRAVYQDILSSTSSEVTKLFCTQALIQLKKVIKPAGYNHGVNEGEAAGQTVHHLHWHIIPRYDGDMEDPRGGVRYVIPKKGNYKKI